MEFIKVFSARPVDSTALRKVLLKMDSIDGVRIFQGFRRSVPICLVIHFEHGIIQGNRDCRPRAEQVSGVAILLRGQSRLHRAHSVRMLIPGMLRRENEADSLFPLQ